MDFATDELRLTPDEWQREWARARDHHMRHQWRKGCLYFIEGRSGKQLAIKIGWSQKNPRARLSALQVGSPQRLEFLGCRAGTLDDEEALHHKLAPWRLSGEWFVMSDEVANELWFLHEAPLQLDDSAEFAGAPAECELCDFYDACAKAMDEAFRAEYPHLM